MYRSKTVLKQPITFTNLSKFVRPACTCAHDQAHTTHTGTATWHNTCGQFCSRICVLCCLQARSCGKCAHERCCGWVQSGLCEPRRLSACHCKATGRMLCRAGVLQTTWRPAGSQFSKRWQQLQGCGSCTFGFILEHPRFSDMCLVCIEMLCPDTCGRPHF